MTDGSGKTNEEDMEESFADIFDNDEPILEGEKFDNWQGKAQPGVAVPAVVLPVDRPSMSCDSSRWLSGGMTEKMLKKILGKGFEAKHDYHQMTVEETWRQMNDDLADDLRNGRKVVEVVHGKGTGELRRKTRAWLKACRFVTAFSEVGGNSGSVLAVLSTKKLK